MVDLIICNPGLTLSLSSRYVKHPGFIACIWIRQVVEPTNPADNSHKRFETAFKDVPKQKYQVYKDADIAKLSQIDVAGGECRFQDA